MLNSEKKKTWNHCKAEGGTADASKEHKIYKNSKKAFEVALKSANRKYETQNMEEIGKCNEIDQVYFLKLVNKPKRHSSTIHPIKLKGNTTKTDPNAIYNAWKEYFQELLGIMRGVTLMTSFDSKLKRN